MDNYSRKFGNPDQIKGMSVVLLLRGQGLTHGQALIVDEARKSGAERVILLLDEREADQRNPFTYEFRERCFEQLFGGDRKIEIIKNSAEQQKRFDGAKDVPSLFAEQVQCSPEKMIFMSGNKNLIPFLHRNGLNFINTNEIPGFGLGGPLFQNRLEDNASKVRRILREGTYLHPDWLMRGVTPEKVKEVFAQTIHKIVQ